MPWYYEHSVFHYRSRSRKPGHTSRFSQDIHADTCLLKHNFDECEFRKKGSGGRSAHLSRTGFLYLNEATGGDLVVLPDLVGSSIRLHINSTAAPFGAEGSVRRTEMIMQERQRLSFSERRSGPSAALSAHGIVAPNATELLWPSSRAPISQAYDITKNGNLLRD